MPREGVLQVLDDLGSLGGGIDEEDVVHLRWHFRVSYGVALLHLMQLGFVSRPEYNRLKDVGAWSLDRRLGYDPDEDRKEEAEVGRGASQAPEAPGRAGGQGVRRGTHHPLALRRGDGA